MGSGLSKAHRIRADLECKDWKLIEKQNPDKNKYLDLWIDQYGFEGKLQSQKIIELRGAIKQKTKNKADKISKEGYDEAEYWLKVALKREEGERRSKKEQQDRRERERKGG